MSHMNYSDCKNILIEKKCFVGACWSWFSFMFSFYVRCIRNFKQKYQIIDKWSLHWSKIRETIAIGHWFSRGQVLNYTLHLVVRPAAASLLLLVVCSGRSRGKPGVPQRQTIAFSYIIYQSNINNMISF